MSKPWAFSLTVTLLFTQAALAQPPVRRFDDPGAPPFTVLRAGVNPPLDVDGNFVIGPDYTPAAERKAVEGVPRGRVQQFTIDSRETKLFNPGIARRVFGKVDPKNPRTLIVETHAIDYKRQITVYIPAQYQAGREAPFMVCHDGPAGRPNMQLPQILDNLIAQKRVPPLIAIMVANGGGDAQGHERGKEYDTMSGMFADYIEAEVLPRVEKNCEVKLTRDPDGRAAMGNSSGGSAALIMAWYRPNLYRRVLTTSGTFVNQQWPFNPETPGGAWDFHETLIPNSPRKPLRIFISVGDRDLLNPNVLRDGMHDWVEANHRMAKVLKAKGYAYQYLFCRNAGHSIGNAQAQFLPHAIEWVWKGYVPFAGNPTQAPPPEAGDMTVLFNGKDLTGWDGDPRLWSAKDGVLRGETTRENAARGNTFLIWKDGALKDFDLRLSFRMNATNNSGIQYRSKHVTEGKVSNPWVVHGYQHELRNERKFPNTPSFIYDEGGKRGRMCLVGEKVVWTAGGKKEVKESFLNQEAFVRLMRLDDWNDVVILAKGKNIKHYLNGRLVVDFTDEDPKLALSEGILALQLHAGAPMWVEFKSIRLKQHK